MHPITLAAALALSLVSTDAFAGRCDRHPHKCDQDSDGLNDAEENSLGTDIHDADSDDDGLFDGEEVDLGTDPLLADTDGDLLLDGDEIALGTDPLLADTDGDGVDDLDDAFPLDDQEWADADCDGIGDNADLDDNDNGVDDSIEVLGGSALVDDPAAFLTMAMVICPWDMVGPVDLGNVNCQPGDVELYDDMTMLEINWLAPGEFEESLVDGAWTLTAAFPGLQTASQRMVGVRVQPGTDSYCYEGMVETLGGSYNAGTGETTYWWFDTGRWSGCI